MLVNTLNLLYKVQHLHACTINFVAQCAKKVLSESLGLEDFAIGVVNFVLSLPDGQVKFCEKLNYRITV